MEIYTATLIVQKHLDWQKDKKHLPKVNEEKLKEATYLLSELVKNLTVPDVVGQGEQLKALDYLKNKGITGQQAITIAEWMEDYKSL